MDCNSQSGKGADEKMASEMIAFCGLDCAACQIYLATREKDPEKQRRIKEQVVQAIKKYYGQEERVEDINDCDGCKAQSQRLYYGCRNCQIKKCASEKRLENCAYCSEYPCDKLSKFFGFDDIIEGGAKKRLDAIKARL